jgi:hypothetical protein
MNIEEILKVKLDIIENKLNDIEKRLRFIEKFVFTLTGALGILSIILNLLPSFLKH